MKHLLVASCACSIAACSDPVTVEQPVGIIIETSSTDVFDTAIARDKGIATEMGNPYGAFITESKAKLGDDLVPNQIVLDSLTLEVRATSINVTKLEEIFAGAVDVQFVIDESNNTYDVGRLSSPTGASATVDILFDTRTIIDEDAARFLGGNFKVAFAGPAATTFAGVGAEADLQLTFGFAAFE